VPVGFECATASLAVIAVLVQASRQRAGVDAIVQAMQFLGRCGIRPDAETMEVIIQSRKLDFIVPNSLNGLLFM
jgi:hypothetical protein